MGAMTESAASADDATVAARTAEKSVLIRMMSDRSAVGIGGGSRGVRGGVNHLGNVRLGMDYGVTVKAIGASTSVSPPKSALA